MIFSGHAGKLINKIVGKITYLPVVIQDLTGAKGAEALAAETIAKPAGLIGTTEMGYFLLLFVGIFGVGGSLYVIWKIKQVSFEDDPRQGLKSAIPFMIGVLFVGAVLLYTVYGHWILGLG